MDVTWGDSRYSAVEVVDFERGIGRVTGVRLLRDGSSRTTSRRLRQPVPSGLGGCGGFPIDSCFFIE